MAGPRWEYHHLRAGPPVNWPKPSEWEEGFDLTEADDEYAEIHPYADPSHRPVAGYGGRPTSEPDRTLRRVRVGQRGAPGVYRKRPSARDPGAAAKHPASAQAGV